ncbi:MAG: multifunctional CCA addition/repair protein [Burkholderiaceae bacterium]|nr:MAG: multifunctional CCA addition/repair protein [Burkholderiaceae bacterium]
MQIYLVGGAVRDALLGLPVQDRDWVVVGATPEAMLAQGYLAVGRDFPVFLHPQTHEEYALARTERKTARGYHGFAFHTAPDVTLEQDLARRDLTINSIAISEDTVKTSASFDINSAALIDPWGGQQDLRAKVFRHVTDAFREDPVRVLRVARFAARFADFGVAPETMNLMRDMVRRGEVDALVAERVWQELARGLMEHTPSRMFEVLRDCGALQRLLPEVDRLWSAPRPAQRRPKSDAGAHLMQVLNLSAQLEAPLPVRFACLTHDLDNGNVKRLKDLCARLRVPTECRELAEVVAREHDHILGSGALDAEALVHLLERCDAFRKPQRFAQVLQACECTARAREGVENGGYPQRERLLQTLACAQQVARNSIATDAISTGAAGPRIGEMIHQARVAAVAASLPSAGA